MKRSTADYLKKTKWRREEAVVERESQQEVLTQTQVMMSAGCRESAGADRERPTVTKVQLSTTMAYKVP